MDIFEACKTDHIATFLEKYPETFDLTFEEVKILKFLCETANKLQFQFFIGPENNFYMPCIFKSNNLWIVWRTDDRGTFWGEKAFDNILDAGNYLFNLCLIIDATKSEKIAGEKIYNLAINYLNELLNQDLDKESIIEFANHLIDYEYNITDLDSYKLKK